MTTLLRILSIGLCSAALLSPKALAASAGKAHIRASGPVAPSCSQYYGLAGARIFSSPAHDATVLLRLKSGTRVLITGAQPKAPFARVHVPGAGVFGFMHRQALRCRPPARPASPRR